MNETNEQLKLEAEGMRAREAWTYYDTVNIRSDADKSVGWFQTFADLANRDEISFFDARSRATVGASYCNLDTISQIDVGFEIHSLGIQVNAPPYGEVIDDVTIQQKGGINQILFARDLLNHCSFELWIGQDQKIDLPVTLLPGGAGPMGNGSVSAIPAAGTFISGVASQFTNGTPILKNRFEWAKRMEVPKNHRLSGRLRFSQYAKYCLERMGQPDLIFCGDLEGTPALSECVPANYGIVASIIGTRIVELRNAQTAY